jgi:hypothetical protein
MPAGKQTVLICDKRDLLAIYAALKKSYNVLTASSGKKRCGAR